MTTPLPDAAATEAWGEEIGRLLRSEGRGVLLAVEGPMGVGKTTFVRGLARGLGVRGNVASPSFQILRIHEGHPSLWHVDLYRLPRGSREFDALDLTAAVEGGAVVAVEWPERAPAGAMEGARRVRLDFDQEARRGEFE
jgi:tRNA threonylcarbamoyladenosine biosynthesis protein TsaE